MNKLVRDSRPPPRHRRGFYIVDVGDRIVATARGQEVQLIRGSEWQTGVRLCPPGGHTQCSTPGIRGRIVDDARL